jgi:hypothetical protein
MSDRKAYAELDAIANAEIEKIVAEAMVSVSAVMKTAVQRVRETAHAEAAAGLVALAAQVAQQITGGLVASSPGIVGNSNSETNKPVRATWGASRAAILEGFKESGESAGVTLVKFQEAGKAIGHDLAMSSIRSMALQMERRRELRRSNGLWFLVREDLTEVMHDLTEKESAAPSPYAEDTADPTPHSAANAGYAVAG